MFRHINHLVRVEENMFLAPKIQSGCNNHSEKCPELLFSTTCLLFTPRSQTSPSPPDEKFSSCTCNLKYVTLEMYCTMPTFSSGEHIKTPAPTHWYEVTPQARPPLNSKAENAPSCNLCQEPPFANTGRVTLQLVKRRPRNFITTFTERSALRPPLH